MNTIAQLEDAEEAIEMILTQTDESIENILIRNGVPLHTRVLIGELIAQRSMMAEALSRTTEYINDLIADEETIVIEFVVVG